MVLSVRPDPSDLLITDTARFHYEAKLFLRDAGRVPPLAETEVAEIQSYKFSKATAEIPRTLPETTRMGWVQQFLQPNAGLPQDGDLIDMCLLLQSLYRSNGLPVSLPALSGNFAVRQDLNHNSLIYIKLVYVIPAFQRQRLGQVLFNSYYRCLRMLPECMFAP